MPEITDAEHRQLVSYSLLGTPEEVRKKIGQLEDDNKAQRDTIRDLKAAQPAEGSVIVPKEKADALAAYEKLGKPDELATVASERDELRQKDAARTRRDAITAAVGAMGWAADTVATIEDMASLQGARFEVEATKNEKGEDVETAYITLAGEGQAKQKLADFATTNPALKGLRTEAKKEEAGTRYFKQEADGSPPKGKTEGGVDDAIKANQDRARAPNALRPAKAT